MLAYEKADLIAAALQFANNNRSDFINYLKEHGHFDTAELATEDNLDELRQEQNKQYSEELDK